MDCKTLVKRYEEQNEELRKLNSILTKRIYHLLQENESLTSHVSFMRDFNEELIRDNMNYLGDKLDEKLQDIEGDDSNDRHVKSN
ncbi:hypothetical protein P4U13_28915 [Bacillus paranthracis]|uniref:hypothetical protein n=1 Tax=Bacillus cereus group TaxID=86661 RepID=UPI001298D653|nr:MULTISPECIES: hypothetical protein [Bacillus cereus group]MEB8836543.1 hypothetical protein [Bacillus cereus]MDY7501186.1 hypothetical protein [Bacillus thuringiensis]MED1293370.1 hypothetical protein [Bacillus paranthracis]MED2811964.1 hypothetical protein [Bacillus thuringiensis]MRC13761.1 hypothetical protein [Bacillus thuringiensis]